MTRRFLIAAAVLAAGCEQLKAPKRLKDLEGRVDELTAQVEAMKGKPAAGRPKLEGHKGSGDAGEGHGSGDAHDGSGEAHGSGDAVGEARAAPEEHGADARSAGEAHDGDAHGAEQKPAGEAKVAGEPKVAEQAHGEGSAGEGHAADGPGSDEHAGSNSAGAVAHAAAEMVDAGVGSAGDGGVEVLSKTDRALQDIANLMASTKQNAALAADRSLARKAAEAAEAHARAGKKPGDADKKPGEADKKPGDKAAGDKPRTPEWAYDGKTGPDAWATLDPAWRACRDGKAQSPIDIAPRAGSASPIVFHYQATPATILDDGHALQVDLAPGSSIEIDDHTYQLVQLQVHRPSEHAIAGEHYPLEVQLVHKDSKGRLAMIAVLYDAGAESRPLGGLWARWPRKVGVEDKLRPFDPSQLLPDTRTVYRYSGSLTRPPCTEGVVWNVMRRTMTESRARLDALGQHYKINGRDTQPLNGRKIE